MIAFSPLASLARLRTWAFVAACAMLLSACGFALRQPPVMPFRTITLNKFTTNSPLASELARALEASGVDVIEPPAVNPKYHVILEAITDSRDQIVATSTSSAQVRELNLRTRFGFRLLRADGSVLLPATELSLARELTYNEQDALSKENESVVLHRSMQTDIVSQTLRRLAAVQLR